MSNPVRQDLRNFETSDLTSLAKLQSRMYHVNREQMPRVACSVNHHETADPGQAPLIILPQHAPLKLRVVFGMFSAHAQCAYGL